jgi:hypothetical protein
MRVIEVRRFLSGGLITFDDGLRLLQGRHKFRPGHQCSGMVGLDCATRRNRYVLGQVYQAMNADAEADAAFTRSLSILEKVQCPPELAETLLAYGRFRQGKQCAA